MDARLAVWTNFYQGGSIRVIRNGYRVNELLKSDPDCTFEHSFLS